MLSIRWANEKFIVYRLYVNSYGKNKCKILSRIFVLFYLSSSGLSPDTPSIRLSSRLYDAPMLKKEKVELPSCNIIQMGGRTPPITNRSGFLVAAAPPPSEIGARKL